MLLGERASWWWRHVRRWRVQGQGYRAKVSSVPAQSKGSTGASVAQVVGASSSVGLAGLVLVPPPPAASPAAPPAPAPAAAEGGGEEGGGEEGGGEGAAEASSGPDLVVLTRNGQGKRMPFPRNTRPGSSLIKVRAR